MFPRQRCMAPRRQKDWAWNVRNFINVRTAMPVWAVIRAARGHCMKRMETHQVFDSFWKERGMSRTQGYKWMAKKLRLSEELAHIGGFEMDRCQKLIRLCEKERNKEKKKETA